MIYITYVNLYDKSYCGITKKIMSQIKVLKKYFGKVYYTICCGQMIYLMNGDNIIDKELAFTKQMCNTVLCTWIEKYKIQRTYIRYNFSDKWFLKFLKFQKEKDIKSVLEIPTYPYDGEIESKRVLLEDQYYREQLYHYIKWVATNSNSKSVLGIPCIRLLNGVDMEENLLCLKKRKEKKIVLICVGSMLRWHGYERIIIGLSNYYRNNGIYNFHIKMVGDGLEIKKYHMLTIEHGLQSRIEFCGMLEGENLNKQYELADIAVASLGLYKTDIHDVTPIKGAEYCARGIPFICGYHDMRFPNDAEYIMTVPNNSEPIDMNEVITFYENIVSKDKYQEKMRDYALQYLSWDTIMKPISEALI